MFTRTQSVGAIALGSLALSGSPASADLLGIDPGFPSLVHENPGGTSYDATTDEYLIVSDAISLQLSPGTPAQPVEPTTGTGQRFVRLHILVADDGTLIGGPVGPDLVIVGAVDADGDGTLDYDGTLLTGEIVAFGFLDAMADSGALGDTDTFDFRFRLTGGMIAGLYAGDDIGVVNTSMNSTFEDFSIGFEGDAQGVVGPIAPVGACCLAGGGCAEAVPQDECEAGGGTFGGRDSTCLSAECPGACCLADGSCVTATRTKCAAAGGDFRGEESSCDDVDCAPPSGACCFPDGSCLVHTQDECRSQGGAYQGSGTTCVPELCPAPEGACCFPNGACLVLTEEDCIDQGGVYQGDDVTCAPEQCGPPKGACCLPNGCSVIRENLCGILGGEYQGDETICFPGLCDRETGACCLPDGTCVELTATACAKTGGTYQRDGVRCTPDTLGEPGRYRLSNHPDAGQAPPPYGVRLDELFDVTGGNDVFTFDFDAPGAEMLLDYDGASIRIHGTAFGGLDVGDGYDPDRVGFVDIDFTYAVVGSAPGDDDLVVTTPSGANSGTVRWLRTGEVIAIQDKANEDGLTFRFGDEDDDAGHRDFDGISGWGWLMYADGHRGGTRDWIFTARGLCPPR